MSCVVRWWENFTIQSQILPLVTLIFSRFGAAKQFQKVPPAEQNFESLQKDGQTSRAFNSSRH